MGVGGLGGRGSTQVHFKINFQNKTSCSASKAFSQIMTNQVLLGLG